MSTLQMSILLHNDNDATQTSWWIDGAPDGIKQTIESFKDKAGYGAYIAATFVHNEDIDSVVQILTAMKQMLSNKPSVNNSSTHWTNDD